MEGRGAHPRPLARLVDPLGVGDVLADRAVAERGRVAAAAYTYLHLGLVAGIVLTALGLETAMAHLGDVEPFGLFGAAALCGGAACYLAGTVFVARQLLQRRPVTRLVGAVLILLSIPLVALLTPLVALAGVAAALVVLVAVEWAASRSATGGASLSE